MKRSIFDSILQVTKETSVVTVVMRDDRYCLILEYFNDSGEIIFETFEFSPSKNINKAYSKSCVEKVNKEPLILQFAEIHHNYYTFVWPYSKKDVLESINFGAQNYISSSYNVKYDQQIVLSLVSDGKELVYSNKVELSSGQDQTSGIIPTNSKKWVTDQLKQLGIDFLDPFSEPDYKSTNRFCSLL